MDFCNLVAEGGGALEFEVGSGELHFAGEGFDERGEFFARDSIDVDFVDQRFFWNEGAETFADGFFDARGGDVVFFIVGHLDFPTASGFRDGFFHAFGDEVGVHDDFAFDVAGGAADGLDEG